MGCAGGVVPAVRRPVNSSLRIVSGTWRTPVDLIRSNVQLFGSAHA